MSNPSDEREQCQKKRKSTICEASNFRTSRRRFCSNNKNEEEMNNKGVSTTLKLYDDPWKIKKTLTDSDLGILSRLLLAADLVKKQILPMLGAYHARAAETEGTPVRVWDMDCIHAPTRSKAMVFIQELCSYWKVEPRFRQKKRSQER
uniref:Truncated E1 protein n=1 Tax=Glycine max TaxID=3847 RepID=A0A0K2B733_SOYBN|nr:truncated E1 protein [Glycine max]